jgi:AGCS family alanine or glycine:cation symporter
MKQTTEAFSGRKNCVTPASAIRRFLVACMAFTLSVAPAFAQEAEDEKGVSDQVDAVAGWVVGKIAAVFFYPIWTFDKVGDQVKEVKTEAGGSGYAVGDIVVIEGGKTADDAETNKTKFKVKSVKNGEVQELTIESAGLYSEIPENPVSATGGRGTGLSVNIEWEPDSPTIPLVVGWLVVGAVFFTIRMGFINFRGFKHAVDVVRGKYDNPDAEGEVSHFQALSSALSATVGLGNIAGVAIAVSLGGPGAIFWMIIAGFLGMSSKFTECTLGQKYRETRPDGRVMGGAMFYLTKGLAEKGFGKFGKVLAVLFAVLCIGGSFGGGNSFQVNQSLGAVGETIPWLADHSWVYGLVMAVVTGLVIIGGIKRIALTAEKIVPAMCGIYLITCLVVLFRHASEIPAAFGTIFGSAFSPSAAWGGFIGVLVIGFKRAAFSNEAGVGSAAIAHSAAKTKYPVREGIVALLEPFIDTIIVCTMTGLVIVITGHYEGGIAADIAKPFAEANKGAALTSTVFASEVSWFPYVLSVAVVLFAFSTMISWSYYGERCWAWLFGDGSSMVYRWLFLLMVFLGSIISSTNVLDFGDLMILGMAFPNVLGLYFLAGGVKSDLNDYLDKLKKGEFEKTQ